MSASDSVTRSLDAIGRHDGATAAFVDVLADEASRDAAQLDGEPSRGPLHGVPIAVKELFDVARADGSYGSLVLVGRRAKDDSAVVASLRRAGCVVIGTTRAHEFGWGITTQHATRGSTRNPWQLDRVPGGSSGGSAAAVAAGIVPLAVASDTGGSIRIPSSFCGVFGLKTTPGRISRRGGVPLAPTFDTVGFVAREPSLLAAALAVTAGPESSDPPTIDAPKLGAPVADETLATRHFAIPDVQPPVSPTEAHVKALDTVASALAGLGVQRVDATVPSGPAMYDAFVPLQMAEAYDIHHNILETYPKHAEEYGPDVRRRLELAADVDIGCYLDARRRASELRVQYLRAFENTDLVLTLVSSTGPSTITDPDTVDSGGRSFPLRDVVMPYTVPQNVAALPSVTVPAGFDSDGLPIGVQIVGGPWSEPLLLAVAEALHRVEACRVGIPASSAGED